VCAVSYVTVKQAVRRLHGHATILSLEPTTLQGIFDTIRQVGEATGTSAQAASLTRDLEEQADTIAARTRTASGRPRVFAMEWLDPPFTAGHWVPELVRRAGGQDELALEGYPSTQIPWRQIADYDPEIIVLMPCGFSWAEHWRSSATSRSPRNGAACVPCDQDVSMQ